MDSTFSLFSLIKEFGIIHFFPQHIQLLATHSRLIDWCCDFWLDRQTGQLIRYSCAITADGAYFRFRPKGTSTALACPGLACRALIDEAVRPSMCNCQLQFVDVYRGFSFCLLTRKFLARLTRFAFVPIEWCISSLWSYLWLGNIAWVPQPPKKWIMVAHACPIKWGANKPTWSHY